MKKKILIIHFNMELGGAESSLLGLLDTFDYDQYDVSLFLYSQNGPLLPYINKNVHLMPEIKEYKELTMSIASNYRDKMWRVAIPRSIAKIRSMISRGPLHEGHNYKQYFHKLCCPFISRIPGEYDLAISFNDPHFIIGKKVTATHKMSWFHTDAAQIAFYDKLEKEMWSMSDFVVNVSDKCKESFDKKHPYLRSRSIVIENILSKSYVKTLSNSLDVHEEMPKNGMIRLLSIGRFSAAKNFDNVPDICRRIREYGEDVIWYIIGFGDEEELIRSKIKEAGMEKYVIILGRKDNPYPYIKECDFYIQPSRFEGKCVSVREAQMLCKPVIITDYSTAENQLESNVDGIIVPMDNQKCAKGIVDLIHNPEIIDKICLACSSRDYSNSGEILKIYNVL